MRAMSDAVISDRWPVLVHDPLHDEHDDFDDLSRLNDAVQINDATGIATHNELGTSSSVP